MSVLVVACGRRTYEIRTVLLSCSCSDMSMTCCDDQYTKSKKNSAGSKGSFCLVLVITINNRAYQIRTVFEVEPPGVLVSFSEWDPRRETVLSMEECLSGDCNGIQYEGLAK